MVDKTQQDLKHTNTVPEKPAAAKAPTSPTAKAVSPAATIVAATTTPATTTASTSPTLTDAIPASSDASKPLITDGNYWAIIKKEP